MSDKVSLYYKDANYETMACLIALETAGFEVDFVRVDQKSLFGKEMKAINPSSITPFAHCNKVTYLLPCAILRLAAQKAPELYGGEDILTKAKVDTIVDTFLNIYSNHSE